MNPSKTGNAVRRTTLKRFGFFALCLLVLLGLFFWGGLQPGHTVFSNDGPLGAISAQCARLPGPLFGLWQDLNWLGGVGPSAVPSVSIALSLVSGPLLFSKIFPAFALLFLGLSAWFCFRQWKFSPLVCFLGGLAAALNSDFFSTACWGVAAQPIAFGLNFLALGALADETSPKRWVRVILAGFAVGMGVMEAYDIGAIFSLFVAAFVLYQALSSEGAVAQKLGRGLSRLTIVAVFAGFLAAAALSTLIGTQIKGIAGTQQSQETKQERWDYATQWSLPKRETLSVLVPGLFGYRMDTPEGGNYWGAVGRDPAWDRYYAQGEQGPRPRGTLRFNGGGIYAGVLVVAIALWAAFQSFRKGESVFTLRERKLIWFWLGAGFIALLLAFGRFAPFYQFFYALPYASTIRNPAKFIHVVEWVLVILFAYGLQGLSRSRLEQATAVCRDLSTQLQTWWAKASASDRLWVKGSAVFLGISVVGWLVYASSRDRFVAYLQSVDIEPALGTAIAAFSTRQVAWFVLFLALALGLLTLLLSGYFNGRRAKVAGVLLGLLLVLDLGRANLPWVITYDWQNKYATNPVLDLLRDKPYQQRVAILPFSPPSQLALLGQLYRIEWAQHQFQFYNIQSLDLVQMPRVPVDMAAFEGALQFDGTSNTLFRVTRRWQLTNTRYLLGAAGFLEVLNQQIDPQQHRFRIATTFDIVPKPGVANPTGLEELTAVLKPDGQYAVFEFTGALPRAKLFSQWQVNTNDQAVLNLLGSPDFDPAQKVLVNTPSPELAQAGTAANATSASAGTVDFVSYAPKQVVLHARASAPSVLLLNDKFDPNWQVSVDGKPAPLLRCNYIMRGVSLPAGDHQVEFRFAPPVGGLYVSLASIALGLGLIGFLAISKPPEQVVASTPAPAPAKTA